ncbi:MAG: helix-turn-helix domain-containing protein, partial [Lachnospiraceae bacterium]|nr:helix-turn-helix domain-containing protein [Lachnospiraceae bacterium]
IKVEKSNKYLYDSKAEGGSLFDEATCKEIRSQYNFEHKAISQWDKHGMSIRELALKYSCSPNTIQRILKGTYVAKKEKKYISTT